MKLKLRSRKINWMTLVLIGLAGSFIANVILLYGFFEMRKEFFNQYKYNISVLNQVQARNHR